MTITTINNSFHAVQQYVSSYNTPENKDLAIKVTLAFATVGAVTLLVQAYNKRDLDESISASTVPSPSGGCFTSAPSNDNDDNSPAPRNAAQVALPLFRNEADRIVTVSTSSPNKNSGSNERSITPSQSPENHAALLQAIQEVLTPENKNSATGLSDKSLTLG